jgi:hypothetical protein
MAPKQPCDTNAATKPCDTSKSFESSNVKRGKKDERPPLGVVYTVDREVVPRLCKICDWLLNSSWGHFGLHQGGEMSE